MEFNINKNDLVEPALLASNVSEKRERIKDLSEIPSPYLTGVFDKL